MSEPSRTEIVAALTRARELIAAGWCQGQCQDGDRYCVVGAIAQASAEHATGTASYRIWQACRERLEAHMPNHYPSLVAYNDFDGTQDKILALVDAALADLGQSQ